MTFVVGSPTSQRPDVPASSRSGAPSRHVRLAAGVAFTGVVAASSLPGLGLAVAAGAALFGTAVVVRTQPVNVRWCVGAAGLLPWLVVRDNPWLALAIVATTALVVALSLFAGATSQRIDDLSVAVPSRREDTSVGWEGLVAPSSNGQRVAFGIGIALPIVAVFHQLLASADAVFANWFDPALLPVLRIAALVVVAPLTLVMARCGSDRALVAGAATSRRLGAVESTIVLGAVSALFAAFIAARVSTHGQPLENLALRGEVREGFFQLLWVAALTVVLVLALRAVSGTTSLAPRVRRLGRLAIGLAGVIDILALVRISEYIDQTFHTPLRFWSFSFGIWLLVVLALSAVRLGGFRADRRWFTGAVVTTWVGFIIVLGVVNPDHRIAQHNFDNASTSQVEWVAVNNLISLSEDATLVITANIDVLRPMPNTRFERMVAHLCATEPDSYPREFNMSRRSASAATGELCGRD